MLLIHCENYIYVGVYVIYVAIYMQFVVFVCKYLFIALELYIKVHLITSHRLVHTQAYGWFDHLRRLIYTSTKML